MSRYRNPAAIVHGQQPATDTQTTEQIVECCAADAGLQSNLRQTAGHMRLHAETRLLRSNTQPGVEPVPRSVDREARRSTACQRQTTTCRNNNNNGPVRPVLLLLGVLTKARTWQA